MSNVFDEMAADTERERQGRLLPEKELEKSESLREERDSTIEHLERLCEKLLRKTGSTDEAIRAT